LRTLSSPRVCARGPMTCMRIIMRVQDQAVVLGLGYRLGAFCSYTGGITLPEEEGAEELPYVAYSQCLLRMPCGNSLANLVE
jgi:hypothetical protein